MPETQSEAALLPNGTLKAAKNTQLKALEGETPTIPSSDGVHLSNRFVYGVCNLADEGNHSMDKRINRFPELRSKSRTYAPTPEFPKKKTYFRYDGMGPSDASTACKHGYPPPSGP